MLFTKPDKLEFQSEVFYLLIFCLELSAKNCRLVLSELLSTCPDEHFAKKIAGKKYSLKSFWPSSANLSVAIPETALYVSSRRFQAIKTGNLHNLKAKMCNSDCRKKHGLATSGENREQNILLS